ncbi:hypothetical protein G7Y89_g6985 [Cudoniella acicularis]|uniref:Response regulatory domain-containing protein n=1 Tax=Cudoniella acicularis TaxID=354080 RepID=A0A8H4W2D2_9HELO|nr:hypothetical protein G7Y89_g6985 [Cudoniella acicularis]
MVSRIVRNMDGQLRLKSDEGKGSRFIINLPFVLPVDESENTNERSIHRISAEQPSVPSPSPGANGGVTLVEKPSSLRPEAVIRKRSIEEIASLHSFKSGSSNKSNKSNKSDVDRLIDAISGPLAVGEPESPEKSHHRSNSRGSYHSRKSAGSIGTTAAVHGTLARERPRRLTCSRSYGAPEHLRSPCEGYAGSEYVTDNKTLLKAVRMSDEFAPFPEKPQKHDAEYLQILVAEDDPINSKIIQKRLKKSGHEVHHTVNGEDCASAYGEKPAFFDVVLMDMQMPIVDGLSSTKMIRSLEKSHPQSILSRAFCNGRVPIFAVSASLVECERQTYVNAGFDG